MNMTLGGKPYKLQMNRVSGGAVPGNLIQANDGDAGDDFEGSRNWTFMLVLFAAFAGWGSPALLSLL